MINPHLLTLVTPVETKDRREDSRLDYGVTATRVDRHGWMQQTAATETITSRDQRTTRFTLFSDDLADMTALHRIEWNGRTFQVDGEPSHLDDLSGYHHTEADLLEVTG